MVLRTCGVALVLLLAGLSWKAQAADNNYFAGMSISIYNGNAAGGGTDLEVRLVAKYLPRFIPGSPKILPRYMPGAGGSVLGNFLFRVAAPDGLTLGMPGRSGFLLSNVIPQDGIIYKMPDFSYVGASGGTSITLWVRKATGVTSLAELIASKKEIVIGALAPRSQSAAMPRALAEYHKWPMRVIAGYPGFSEVYLGIERGELDGLMTAGAIFRSEMVTSGLIVPVLQSMDEIPGVALLSSLEKGPEEKAVIGLLEAPSLIGLPLMGPPGIPADRLEILRKAYHAMSTDPEFRAEAEKLAIPLGKPVNGPELQKIVAENLSSVSDTVLKKYISLTDK